MSIAKIPYFATRLTIVFPNKKPTNVQRHGETAKSLAGRLIALDPGDKRVGVAVSDELRLTARPLSPLHHSSWKKLLSDVKELVREFDAKALVIGLPVSLDGVERSSALKVRQLAQKFSLSLDVPVFLQDERLTSKAAEDHLRELRHNARDIRDLLDSEAATIILRDFMLAESTRLEVPSQDKNSTSTD